MAQSVTITQRPGGWESCKADILLELLLLLVDWSRAIYSKPRSHTHAVTLKTERCKNVFRPNMTFEPQETRRA